MWRLLVNPVFRTLFLFFVLGCLVFVVREGTGIKQRISNIVFETYIHKKPRLSSEQLVFVDIDDISLSKINAQWPWPRTKIAEVIKNINASGAKVIVFDGVLAEPDRTSAESIAALLDKDHPARNALEHMQRNDLLLAEEIKNAGNFVAGFSHGSNTSPPLIKRKILIRKEIRDFFLAQKDIDKVYFATTAQFLPELQESAAGNGSFMASAESDAVIRRTGLIFHNGNELFPSLVLEGLRLYENEGRDFIKVSDNELYNNYRITEPFEVTVGDYKIPMDADGKMWVYFREFGSDESISAYRFLNEYYDKETVPDLTGKVVFIASSAEGLMDLRATPLGMRPGVHVHMNALEQILQKNFLIRPYTANVLEIGAAVVFSILIIVLSFFINPIWLAVIVVSTVVASFWGSWNLFVNYGGLFDPVTPSIMIVLIFIASSILSYLKTELDRQQVKGAFGHYISPDFMRELTKDPDKLKLGGEIRDLTIMFTDIRRFTSISEGLTPEELIQLMNDFLTPMSDLVMKNRGTIDKYMGDAMMAFWNAPLDDPNHATNACRAALKMQDALEPINAQVKIQAEAKGKEPVLLQAGIGINTGPCAVGNMGSRQRFAYSTLGDAVNLASRLEGQTKTYGVGILVGESTVTQAKNMAFLELDLLQVKGKLKPVKVYALLGDEEFSQEEAFKKWKEAHNKMIEQYRSQDFQGALQSLSASKTLSNNKLDDFYELYAERITSLLKEPPGEGWDGVFVATSK